MPNEIFLQNNFGKLRLRGLREMRLPTHVCACQTFDLAEGEKRWPRQRVETIVCFPLGEFVRANREK